MVTLKTFDGSQVTPEDDSAILKTLLPDGIISGCDFTVSEDNKIHISDGYIVFKGRNIQIVNESFSAKLSREGTVDGSIYLKLDLNNKEKPITIENEIAKIEYTENEMLLATYKATVTGVFELERLSNITNNQLVDVVNNIVNGENPIIADKPIQGKLLWSGSVSTGTTLTIPNLHKYNRFTFICQGYIPGVIFKNGNDLISGINGFAVWHEILDGSFLTVTFRGTIDHDKFTIQNGSIPITAFYHYTNGNHSRGIGSVQNITSIYGVI